MTAVTRRVRALALILIAALGLALVPAVAANAAGPGSMTLTVTSETPLGFLTLVSVEGPDGIQFTSVEGNTATLSDLALGDYTATVGSSPAGPGGSVSFTLTASAPAFAGEIVLASWPTGTGSVAGTILDDQGGPVVGAFVNLTSGPRPFPTAFTAADGTYAFAGLPAGEYTLTASSFDTVMRSTAFTLADGEAAVVDLVLPLRNASITGRLVDGAGNPIADTFVEARSGSDFGGATSGADGTFVIASLSAGDWTIIGGGPGTPWLPNQTSVTLAGGENATIADLVLAPRTTGDIAGYVSDNSLPFPQSIEGICARLLRLNGSQVPGQAVTTGVDGTYFFADLAPGSYKVRFTDCDASRVPQFESLYYGPSATLAGATTISVSAGQFVNLDGTTLTRKLPPKPHHDAKPVKARDLTSATRDDIDAPSAVTQNHAFVTQVGTQYAGQWVSVWLRTPNKQLGGWLKVAADGTVRTTVPSSYPIGSTQLVVQDADNHVVGWTTMRVRSRLLCAILPRC